MMRMLRASVIGLSLLAWAATAYAECGWVLWRGKSNPRGGYETKQACETLRNFELLAAGTLSGKQMTRKEIENVLKSTDLTTVTSTIRGAHTAHKPVATESLAKRWSKKFS